MKVLSFSSCFPSRAGPTEGIFVLDRLAAVARRAEVRVVHPVPSCPLVGPIRGRRDLSGHEVIHGLGVDHRRFSYLPGLLKRLDGWFYSRGLFRWVAQECRRDPPDLLDAHFAWPDGVGVSLLARRLKLPYVVTLRGTINPRLRARCFRRQMGAALTRAAAVISVSRPMADIAVRLGAEPARVHVIPNGVNARLFQPVPRAEARRRLGLDAARPLLVCVASLKRPKGQADLIRAARRTPREVHLALIGRAAGGRGYLRRLRALAGSLGLDGRVRFLGGVDRATVAAYLNAADVSILPSHCEGCPNVVLESLACGTPVVATTVGGVPDLIRPGATGLLVPPGDASALTSALLDALSGRWSRDVIRASVADRSWDSVAEKVLQVFRSAVACR